MTLPPNFDELPVLSTERGATFVREELSGGLFRLIQSLRPVNFFRDGAYREIINDYVDTGIGARPFALDNAPLMASVGAGGTRRLHPTRETDVYLEIGRPYNVATRTPYTLNPLVRSGNLLTSTNTLADVMIWHGGHFSKLGIELKGSWRTAPPAQFAFPVTLSGLTWNAGVLSKDGVPVMRLSAPVMYDVTNPQLRRAIPWDFVNLAGQMYVVFDTPSTAGMSRPLIDPTLTLQPGAAAGKDTSIYEGGTTINMGASDQILVGSTNAGGQDFRTFLAMDYSGVPDNAIISQDTLSLFALADNAGTARTFRVYRMKRSWAEGTGMFTASGDGATWATYDGVNTWTAAGGFHANDCEQTDIGSRAFTATETLNVFKDFPLTPTTKAALDLGYGRMIKADVELDDRYTFASSDHVTAANRPKEVIVFATPSGRGVFTIPFGNAFQGAFGA